MSARSWKKRQKFKKSEKKRLRDVIVPFGAIESPNGADLQLMDCLTCSKPTTEHWLLNTGKVGCGRCVASRDEVFLALAQEESEEGANPKLHLLSPSLPFTEGE